MEKDAKKESRHLLFILTAAFALSHMDRQILAITLNDIGIEFQLTDLQLGLLSGIAFAIIYVILGFPVAKITRPGNRIKIVTIALALWSAMTALSGFANSFVTMFLARVGVGVGEAGCAPPSHSMIIDAYPIEKRAGAIAFYSAGANVGIFLAFLIGGVLAQFYGWRAAFFVAGIPGIFLAIWVYTLKEPIPTQTDEHIKTDKISTVAKSLFKEPSVCHAIIGAALTAMIGYGAIAWASVFLIRSHGLNTAEAGIFLALVIGTFGALGTWLGGILADKFGAKDKSWRLKFIAVVVLIMKPLSIGFYLFDNTLLAMATFVLPAATGTMFIGPTLSHAYSHIEPINRPMVTAIFMLIINLVGLGAGPVIVGWMSTTFEPTLGTESLRISLALFQIIGIWAAAHYWIAGSKIKH